MGVLNHGSALVCKVVEGSWGLQKAAGSLGVGCWALLGPSKLFTLNFGLGIRSTYSTGSELVVLKALPSCFESNLRLWF